MALITCPECGKEYSDFATACPNCGCPTTVATTPMEPEWAPEGPAAPLAEEKPKRKFPFVAVILLLILLGVIGFYTFKIVPLQAGKTALYVNGDYTTARQKLEGLNYQNSETMLTDLEFLELLQKYAATDLEDGVFELDDIPQMRKALKRFKAEKFTNENLPSVIDVYLRSLDELEKAFDEDLLLKNTVLYQENLLASLIDRIAVYDYLHTNFGFMKDSADLKAELSEQDYNERMLSAMIELDKAGHVETKDTKLLNNYVEYFYRNDTDYDSVQTFIFTFYDYGEKNLVDTRTVEDVRVRAHEEYSVRCNVPNVSGYTVYCSYVYTDIDVD